jgi:hypothetical protein
MATENVLLALAITNISLNNISATDTMDHIGSLLIQDKSRKIPELHGKRRFIAVDTTTYQRTRAPTSQTIRSMQNIAENKHRNSAAVTCTRNEAFVI